MSNAHQFRRIAAAAGAALGFCLLVLAPGERKLNAARGEARAMLDGVAAEAMRYASLEGLSREVAALRRGTHDFEQRIPAEHRLGDFLRDLAGILSRSGMENHILQPRAVHAVNAAELPPGSASEFGRIQVQPVVVQCEGRCAGMFEALRGLEELPRLSRVESLKVTADAARPGRVKVEMLLNTYYLPAEAPTGGGA